MGISPDFWGKQAWHFIHSIALNYPENPTEDDKNNYILFLNSLEYVLPCPICGYHFKQNMELTPPKLTNKTDFFNWTVDMHNEVNKSNNKPIITYEQAFKEVIKNGKSPMDNVTISMANSLLNRIKNLKNK